MNKFFSDAITGCSATKKTPMDNSTRINLIQHKEDDDVRVIAVIGKENDRALTHKQLNKSGLMKHRLQNHHRVTEIGNDQKMMLRKRLDSDPLPSETVHYKGIEIPQKASAATFVCKQDRKYKDDSDYVKDSTETSSGGSTFGASTKVRRVHRATRRTRGTREIRRNPIRVTKKNPDKGFPRQRQQLISAKKETFFDFGSAKRGKSSTMPYMNTRSVTRKMYNVGATYQAPTVRDELEWKEWPVHGMHERPVFHPQMGLAAEYLGRYYSSLDGLGYHEIVDPPEIEVVSVDPRCDFLPSSSEKELNRKTKMAKNLTLNSLKTPVSCKKPKSFKTCMHESFHCVLGYCSQVMTPSYKTNVEGKINKLTENKSPKIMKEPEKPSLTRNIVESTVKYKSSASNRESLQKLIDRNKLSNNYSMTMMSQSAKNLNQATKPRLFPAQKVYVANSQKSSVFTAHKTLQSGHLKMQEMMRSNNPLVLVNTSEVKDAQILRPLSSNMNLINQDDNNETLFDIPSVFKNAIPCEELPESSKMILKQPPVKRGNKVEFTVTKYLLDNSQQNRVLALKEPNVSENKLSYETTTKEVNAKVMSDNRNKTWFASDTSEIAKILSEYNKSSTKKPAIENQGFYANLKNIRMKEVPNKENNNLKQSAQDSSLMRNMNIKFPQGKWRRFHLTVEKLKDMKSNSNERKTVAVSNRQSIFKIDHAVVDPAPERHPENFKYLELSQSTKLENKENNQMIVVNASAIKTQSLQDLLENTAMLYCAATGTHQDDLAYYIDSLDAAQSIQWLETCKNVTL